MLNDIAFAKKMSYNTFISTKLFATKPLLIKQHWCAKNMLLKGYDV